MRLFLISTVSLVIGSAAMAGSVRIDGIRVYGRFQDVSRADIREAIDANGPLDKPHELEVISNSEMHAYYKTRELGWTPIRRLKVMRPVGKRNFEWSPDGLLVYAPQVLQVIRRAEEVYVFPVVTPLDPRRNDKHLRLLDGEARRKSVYLLGSEQNWWHGAYHIFVGHHQPTDIGLLFRSRGSELVLFFLDDLVEGSFNGQNTGGEFEFRNGKKKQLLEWKRRYAHAELSAK